jgi:hypothetical protein
VDAGRRDARRRRCMIAVVLFCSMRRGGKSLGADGARGARAVRRRRRRSVSILADHGHPARRARRSWW